LTGASERESKYGEPVKRDMKHGPTIEEGWSERMNVRHAESATTTGQEGESISRQEDGPSFSQPPSYRHASVSAWSSSSLWRRSWSALLLSPWSTWSHRRSSVVLLHRVALAAELKTTQRVGRYGSTISHPNHHVTRTNRQRLTRTLDFLHASLTSSSRIVLRPACAANAFNSSARCSRYIFRYCISRRI
jgi:hypothetical protein